MIITVRSPLKSQGGQQEYEGQSHQKIAKREKNMPPSLPPHLLTQPSGNSLIPEFYPFNNAKRATGNHHH